MAKRNQTIPSYQYFDKDPAGGRRAVYAPYLVGHNLGNPMNHGAIIRLGANIGAKKVFFTSNPERFSMIKIRKTAGSSHTHMSFEFTNWQAITEAIPPDYHWVAIETTDAASNLYQTRLPEKCVFVAGNESYGLPEEVLSKCTMHIYIPTKGHTKSLNVSHAMAVTIFEWLRQRDY